MAGFNQVSVYLFSLTAINDSESYVYLMLNRNSKNCANGNNFEWKLLTEGSCVLGRQFVFREHHTADGV